MSVILFVGPTLPPGDIENLITAECRPPAAQGDVYRAVLDKPQMIGIIDGYFEGVPSVWHKEMLWAMSEGIAVFGSASMGALRAAELHAFGMRGIGRIFEDYRDGVIEDDDEVAVLHAPAELGFQPLSEPMVSVRATIAAAVDAGKLDEAAAQHLIDIAKSLHYTERDWTKILELALNGPLGKPTHDAFEHWLAAGRIDAKRRDALAMIEAMAAMRDNGGRPAAADYDFEWTDFWNDLTGRAGASVDTTDDEIQLVLDELRLDSDRFDQVKQAAFARELALAEAGRQGTVAERDDLLAEMSRHRSEHRLTRHQALRDWLTANDLDEHGYERLIRERSLAHSLAEGATPSLTEHQIAELKWTGDYARLKARAANKAQALADKPPTTQAGADTLKLLNWYFERRLDQPMPDDIDSYVKSIGLTQREDFCRMVEREFDYVTSSGGKDDCDDEA